METKDLGDLVESAHMWTMYMSTGQDHQGPKLPHHQPACMSRIFHRFRSPMASSFQHSYTSRTKRSLCARLRSDSIPVALLSYFMRLDDSPGSNVSFGDIWLSDRAGKSQGHNSKEHGGDLHDAG